MPQAKARARAQADKKQGKSPSTQAGEYVKEEMHALHEGKGPKNPKQAIAIGLSEARRDGIRIPPKKAAKK